MAMSIGTLAQLSCSYMARRLRDAVLVLLVGVSIGAVAAHAQNATWLLSPTSEDFDTAANWSSATAVPTGTATFGASNTTTITFSSPSTSIGTLQFNAGAPAYSFDLASQTLTITGTGIINNSSNQPAFVINNATLAFDSSDTVTFAGLISGNGNVTQSGSGTTILTAANTFTGGTIVNAGTLQLGDGIDPASTTAVTVNNSATFNVMHAATVSGGNGGTGSTNTGNGGAGGTGGAAVSFTTGGSIINSGTLSGGAGGRGGVGGLEDVGNGGAGGNGGNAVSFSTGGTLTNSGTLSGGGGGQGGIGGNGGNIGNGGAGGNGGDAVSFSAGGSLTNSGTLSGGAGGTGGDSGLGGSSRGGDGGNGGAAVSFSGGGILTNSGTISGGAGGEGNVGYSGFGASGTGGFGVVFTGAAGSLTNQTGGHINGGVMMGNFANAITLDTGSVINGILNLGTSTAATLTLDGSGTQLYSAAVIGATTFDGALIKNGTGTWTLDESFTYTGATTINAGTLQIGNGGTRGSIAGDVSDNAALVFDRSGSVTFSGKISGTGSLTQNGSGTLILSGTNSYSGNTNVNAGTLLVDGSLGAGLVSVASGATLGGSGTIGGPVTIQNGGILAPGDPPGTLAMGTLTLNSGSILNYQLGISNVVGGGVNDLVNVNGNLTLAGTLNITNVGGFGEGVYRLFNYTGSLTNNGLTFGTLPTGFTDSELLVQTSRAGQINLLVSASGFTDQFWDGTTTTADGIVHGGSGTWDNVTTNWTNMDAKVNAGWQNGFAIFEGTAGTVTLGANISFIGMQFITDGYTITAPGSQTLIAAPGTTIRVDSGVRATIAAPIVDGSTPGSLTKTDLGTLILTGTNTYSGGTTISGGTLQLGNGGTSGSILGNVIDNATLAFDRSDSVTFGGVISGTGSLVQLGSGTLILTAANTFIGGTTINAGTLALGSGGSIASSSGLTLAASGTGFDISAGGNQTIQDLSGVAGSAINLGANTLTVGTADSTSFAGVISGTGGLTKQGTGRLILSANNPFTGTTTISAGTLQLGTGGTTGGVGSSAIIDNGVLDFDHSDTVTYAGVVSGTGSGVKDGIGTLILLGANTYAGGTTINSGTLQIGNGTTTGSIVGNVIDNAALVFDRSDGVTFNGAISGTGSLTQSGTGSLTLSGANTYMGATTVNAGTLALGSGGSIASSSGLSLAISGAGFDISAGGNQTIQDLSGVTGSTINLGANTLTAGTANSTSFAGVISGTGGFIKQGGGTLTLSGANTYMGATTVNAGTLALGSGGSIASSSGLSLATSGAGFDISAGGNQTIRDLSGVAGSMINLGANMLIAGTANSTSFAGVISGTGGFIKQGGGTLTLSGAETYSGATTVNAGTLALGSGGSIASSSGLALAISGAGFDISAGGNQTIQDLTGVAGSTINLGANTLTAGTANSTSFAGVISGTGGFIKQGTGTLILTGNNTYSGGTSFNGGIVAVDNDGNLGTGALSFNGGTLEALAVGGGITSSKAITLDAGGGTFLADAGTTSTLSGVISGVGLLTKDGLGTLTLTGANIYTGGTTINAGTLQIGNGGTSGSIAGDVSDNATFAFNRSDSVTFGGVISGTGALVQIGSGTLTLTADSSYGGGTTINTGATLQLGNGGTTGSIIGNVNDNGSLIFNRSDNVTFNSLISGAGNLVQNGSGTIILGGANTYSGGTIINNGTLLVNNSRALGLGNVVVNGGTLGADPQPINVKGNYAQNAGGTLQLQVAGANPGQYDTLNVGGNAAFGGTLQLISLGFHPAAGNLLTLVTTGGVVTSRFGQFVDPFATGPGYNTVDLIYGLNFVDLEFLNILPPLPPPPPSVVTIDFESFAQTPNQSAAGNLLDAIQLNPKAADLMAFLYKEPFSNLPGDLAEISPDALTAFYEITFSNANIQRLNLEGRLDDLRAGSNGFSSNMKLNSATVSSGGKATVEGKSAKSPVEQALQPAPENRWGVWVTGFGDFVNVDGDYNGHGYDFTTGGFTVGVDYRITDEFAIGAMGEYAHTWTSLKPSGSIDVDSGRGGVYAAWFSHGFYLDGGIYGGHDVYSSSRATLGGMANGGTGGAEYSAFISGGYDFHCGQLTIGPTAALQYTYINIDSFNEHGSLAPLEIHSQSAESLRTDVGLRAFYQWQIGKVLVEPSLRAAWEHEYKYSALPITAGFAGIPGPSGTFYGPSEGHDSAIVSAGVSVQWTPMIATYVSYDGQLGRSRYDSNGITGGVKISF